MTSSLPPRTLTRERFTLGGRAASLALLRSRIAQVPGLSVLDDPRPNLPRGATRVLIDVRDTGLTGYEIGRRMRRFSGVPLELCRENRLVVIFENDAEIGARADRLLFALGHACQFPVAPTPVEV